MTFENSLSTREIREIFAEEIATVGGNVSDSFNDEKRLFLRSVLPGHREIQRGDKVQGGVALRATEQDIWVHPYVFRLVCRNGAIFAQAIQTWHVDVEESQVQLDFALREAVRACCGEEAFSARIHEMRSTLEQEADAILNMLPWLSRVSQAVGSDMVETIMRTFVVGRDRSAFGLMNAVTSVARDTRDPEVRWRLEELGGGIPALLRKPKRSPRRSRKRVLLPA